MADNWYPTDGSSRLIGSEHAHGNPWDETMGNLLAQWLQGKDREHREPMGAIVLAQYADAARGLHRRRDARGERWLSGCG